MNSMTFGKIDHMLGRYRQGYHSKLALATLVIVGAAASGCYQPQTAKPLQYDRQTVEELRSKIDQIDFEE